MREEKSVIDRKKQLELFDKLKSKFCLELCESAFSVDSFDLKEWEKIIKEMQVGDRFPEIDWLLKFDKKLDCIGSLTCHFYYTIVEITRRGYKIANYILDDFSLDDE